MWKDKSKSWRGFEKAEEMSNGPEVAWIFQRSLQLDRRTISTFSPRNWHYGVRDEMAWITMSPLKPGFIILHTHFTGYVPRPLCHPRTTFFTISAQIAIKFLLTAGINFISLSLLVIITGVFEKDLC